MGFEDLAPANSGVALKRSSAHIHPQSLGQALSTRCPQDFVYTTPRSSHHGLSSHADSAAPRAKNWGLLASNSTRGVFWETETEKVSTNNSSWRDLVQLSGVHAGSRIGH